MEEEEVDCYRKPALKETSGTWRCGILLLVNQGLVILGFSGVEVNLVVFSKSVLRYSHAEAAHTFTTWMGTVYLFSLIGAFLSDCYLGKYLTCLIFQVIYIIVRNGAAEAALAAFGADQFDEEDPKERHSKASFFTYFYLALNLGALAAETILVYIEDMGQWVLAFRICTLSSIVAYGFLLSGNLRYRRFKPCGNPISRFSQVIVPSFRKFNLKMPLNGDQELYEVDLKESERNGMRRILHSAVMNQRVFSFDIPPASMTVFDFIFTSLFIILYERLVFPLHVKVTKREPKLPSALERIGIGLAIASLAMLVAGFVEQQRRKFAIGSLEQETSSLSILWQIPQYLLVGASDAFVYVARMEFFASQAPDGLKSLGIGLSLSASAMGSYGASAILSIVMRITSSSDGKKPGWVPPNLNDGHLDWFYFLSAALAALNFGLFVVCAKHYKPISFEKRDGETEMRVLDST
ncbi:hypothetical protein F8388_014463 [Cannabis sativa]|uniref:Uncharacterized protein n=1 Tax=Cannabis sativa TaxID=3483 RepID=A0A7J6FYB9_CANSA|nr:hypothetical protein F8388_014463 [Cannabis sativa]